MNPTITRIVAEKNHLQATAIAKIFQACKLQLKKFNDSCASVAQRKLYKDCKYFNSPSKAPATYLNPNYAIDDRVYGSPMTCFDMGQGRLYGKDVVLFIASINGRGNIL